jgi:tetratricopeptide (TPR) repeat protein
LEYAAAEEVEQTLWNCHHLINQRYREIVAKYKRPEYKKHAVERRKWEKRYADFLKISQVYYKGYIQRLADHFDIPELRIIAHRLGQSSQSADPPVPTPSERRRIVLISCHQTLLRLGDLYRYRNELHTKEKSWDKANAHYGLANDLLPDSGSGFNQMAVISLADGNHLDAVYNLYRALAVNEPHPVAGKNLEIEFQKIVALWQGNKKTPAAPGPAPNDAVGNMVLWFVRLHAKLYKGEEFRNHDELENEVLSQMTVLLKEQSLEGVLDKIVLINFAAEWFASKRLNALTKASAGNAADHDTKDKLFHTYYFYLRLNVRMMFMLLQLLAAELDGATHGQDVPDVHNSNGTRQPEKISAVTRRILPSLRQYGVWLLNAAPMIVSTVGNAAINIHIKELWSMYCSTLNLLIAAFPLSDLQEVDYLLEEDAATVGFKPLREAKQCALYNESDGSLKKRSTDPGVERHHPNIEMLARIRGILRDATVLALDNEKRFPIELDNAQFHFVEEGLPSPRSAPRNTAHQESARPFQPEVSWSSTHIPLQASGQFAEGSVANSESQESLSTNMQIFANQMVDNLVTPTRAQQQLENVWLGNSNSGDETSYGMHSNTANDVFGGLGQQTRITPVVARFPILNVSSSPFSPRPEELQNSGLNMAPPRLGQFMYQQQQTTPLTNRTNGFSPANANDIWNSANKSYTTAPPTAEPTPALPPGFGPPGFANANGPNVNGNGDGISNDTRSSVAQQLQATLSAQYHTPGLPGFAPSLRSPSGFDFSAGSSSLYQNSSAFPPVQMRTGPAQPAQHMGQGVQMSEVERQMLLASMLGAGRTGPAGPGS